MAEKLPDRMRCIIRMKRERLIQHPAIRDKVQGNGARQRGGMAITRLWA